MCGSGCFGERELWCCLRPGFAFEDCNDVKFVGVAVDKNTVRDLTTGCIALEGVSLLKV